MCDAYGLDLINNKQPHSLTWKAFENIFHSKEEKNYYKVSVKDNPFFVDDINNKIFKKLLKRGLFQYNINLDKYIYSHKNIVNHLFFRNYRRQILCFNFSNSKKIKIINIINQQPTQFINWWLSLNKKKKIKSDSLISFLKDNSIKISVRDHKNIDKNLTDKSLEYLPLNFSDLRILESKNEYSRLYNEYLNENININNNLNRNDLFAGDISYFIYSIHNPMDGEDKFPSFMNSMKITNFHKKINWKNDTQRHKMLNYILCRYVQGYIDSDFSALSTSNLKDNLFSKWDSKNMLNFYEFVKQSQNSAINLYGFDDANIYFKIFDAVLNSGRGKGSILDGSHKYRMFDKRFATARNSSENSGIFEEGHRFVNFWMYSLFEKPINNITIQEMQCYYKKQYNQESICNDVQITPAFEKFMVLLLNRYVYYNHNTPFIEKKFNFNIQKIDSQVEKYFIDNNIQKLYLELKKYLANNKNLLDFWWEVDKFVGKGKSNYIWIRNYERYSIYDMDAPPKSVYQMRDVYDPDGMEYTINDNQYITTSNKKKFNKFIVSYRLNHKSTNEILDNTFIIDFENEESEAKFLGYKDITTWDISDEVEVNKNYEFYENEILPMIKKSFK